MKTLIALIFLLLQSIFSCAQVEPAESDPFQEIQYFAEVEKVSLSDNIEIAFTDTGEGDKTLIFIHGLGGYLKHWQYNVPDLSKEFRCIAVDLAGYGKSSKGDYSGSMIFHAEVLAEFIEKLDLQNVWLVGHSMGGQISMTLALENPSLIEGLVLAAPAGIETFTEVQKGLFRNTVTQTTIMNTSDEQIRANLKINFLEKHPFINEMTNDRIAIKESPLFASHAKTVAGGVAGMVNEPVFDRLGDLIQPCLVIFSSDDALIPNRFMNPNSSAQILANTAKELIPNAEIKVISGAGHLLQVEKASEFNSILRNFIISR
ncbi:alpha/beta fold hydrolase [Fulvivirgaceae bacterium LMO-SS25]